MKRLMVIIIAVILIAANGMAATHYVVTNGTPGNVPADPYDSWTKAGTNIIDVVNCAMTYSTPRMVWVSNGTYYLTNQVTISSALTLQSVNGRDVTIVDGYNYVGKPVTNRCFNLIAAGVMLDGFTITNGYIIGNGGGVFAVTGVTNKNCRITGCIATNIATDYSYGGGLFIDGSTLINCEVIGNISYNNAGGGIFNWVDGVALISNCVIAGNTAYSGISANETHGGGICAMGQTIISDCKIYGNTCVGDGSMGGGARLSSLSTLRNSLICSNSAKTGAGIEVYNSGGTIQNCTIASNIASSAAGGIYFLVPTKTTASVENVVCYFNTAPAGSNIYFEGGTYTGSYNIVNSCIAPTNVFPTSGIEGYYYADNIEFNPQFAGKDTGDWRLTRGSPCINSGTNEVWMNLDLDGHSRIDRFSRIVDMGCYEYLSRGTLFGF